MSRSARTRYETQRMPLLEQLAPPAPPCFSARDQWLVYLRDAAAEQRPGHAPGPLQIEAGKPVQFNPAFDFCRECTERHEGAMKARGRCQPKYLLNLEQAGLLTKEIA